MDGFREESGVHSVRDEGFVDLDLEGYDQSIPTEQSADTHTDEIRSSLVYEPSNAGSHYSSLRNLIPYRKNDKSKESMPLDKAGIFSFITYGWLSSYMKKAYREGLKQDDIPHCSPKDSCQEAASRMERMWNDEIEKRGIEKASLQRVVWRFTRGRILLNVALYLTSLVFGFAGPIYFMRSLLKFVQDGDPVWWHGALWAAGMAGSEFMRVLLFSVSWGVAYRTGTRLKSAVMAMLYRKLMRVSSLGDKSIGEIINLFANDGQRIYEVASFGPFIIGDPFVAVIGTGYTVWVLGPHALLGMLVFVLFYPVQYGVSTLTGYFRRRSIAATDRRVRLMNELLTCIKLIKMYAWEKPFSKSITAIRTKERSYLKATAYVQSTSVAITPVVPIIAVIVTFLAHIGFGYDLTPAEGFAVVAVMISRVRPSLNGAREALKTWDEARVIWPRIKSVLTLEDIKPYTEKPTDPTTALAITGGTFGWHASSKQKKRRERSFWARVFCCNKDNEAEKDILTPLVQPQPSRVLFNINILVPKGKLVGVCGTVGSGKSSLLSAILGQMILERGRIAVDGSFAYVSQQAWIMNCSLKDNILFGEPYESFKYNGVIWSCALGPDIIALPAGDQTEIGERGINLSGGQRQRVSMARALYSDEDIYLLDDPLSAVDSHVGKHIFDHCIKGALRYKTVIFVTHQLQYLNQCDEVIFMDNGRIVDQGNHNDLMGRNERYLRLIQTFMHEDNKESRLKRNVSNLESVMPSLDQDSPAMTRRRKQSVARSITVSTEGTALEGSTVEISDEENTGRLTQEEKVEIGSIPAETYRVYVKAAGGYFLTFILLLFFVINVCSNAFSSWWLAHWLNVGVVNTTRVVGNTTEYYLSVRAHPDLHFYELIYGMFIIVILLSTLMRSFVFIQASTRASSQLHNRLLEKIFSSPMSFFDSTPIGRILNLFSRDLDETDSRLPSCIESLVQNMLVVLVSLSFIMMVVPWFIIALVILAVIFVFFSRIFRCALRDLKRLENVSRSPIYSHVTASISGLSTLRAFKKENDFIYKFMRLFDENSTVFFLFTCSMRWLAVRLDFIAVCIMGVTAGLVVSLHGIIPAAFAGLALAYSSQLTGILQNTVRWASETESRFTSVQRMHTYFQTLQSEGPAVLEGNRPASDWPQMGAIRFSNVRMRYRQNLPLVLKEVTFEIRPREKIGIVGRTGSGKSSLGMCLFRLVGLWSGEIEIDGINIANIGLFDLRSKLSIIPQDPVLFIGTVRYNLDPFQKYMDPAIWEALERTNMKEKIKALPGQLESFVIENGENFSVGERQLICMARALLRHSKILLLDEATAAIDTQTDTLIQQTVREAFDDCTILTIAHRLNTVVQCDRIMVMQDGRVVEFDTPMTLLANPNSVFAGMMAAAEAGDDISM